jgi:hypothetical protein
MFFATESLFFQNISKNLVLAINLTALQKAVNFPIGISIK